MSAKKRAPRCANRDALTNNSIRMSRARGTVGGVRDSLHALMKLDSEAILTGLPDGLQASYTFAPDEWRADCERVIRELGATGQPFTVDSLRRHGIEEPDKPVRWGSVFAAMSKRGVIEQTGVHLHTAAAGGVSAIREWRGVEAVAS